MASFVEYWRNVMARRASPTGISAYVDHGELIGLSDDDHPQYMTDAEATVIAQAEATKISNTMTFLLMGS